MQMSTTAIGSVSRLVLGAAQFGMSYGIANEDGKPSDQQVREILATAIELGVNCVDTAAAYGQSEAVLGLALHELGACEKVTVVTKVRHLSEDERADAVTATRMIEASIEMSRRRLGLDCLPVVLFHKSADATYLDTLESLKERGWLRHAGVSCGMEPGDALGYIADPRVEALQIPCNLLDPRYPRSGIFERAGECNTPLFVRSVYLQGLLVMPESRIPAHLGAVVPVRRALQAIAVDGGITLTELAMRYMLSFKGVAGLVLGVDTPGQLRENIRLVERGPLDGATLERIDATVPALPERILTPAMWQKHTP